MEKKIVNLKRRVDRKIDVDKVFCRENVENYEFIDAVDGKELTCTQEIRSLFTSNNFGYKRGVVGCALSHYYLWKNLVVDDMDYYCIFEDDIDLAVNFNELYEKCLDYIKEDKSIDILFLGYHSRRDKYIKPVKNVEFEGFKGEFYVGGTFAYIVTKKGANNLLNYINEYKIKEPIDNFILSCKGLEIRECAPFIVYSEYVNIHNPMDKIDSDIQKDNDLINFEPEIVTLNNKMYKYYKGLDSRGGDLCHICHRNANDLSIIAGYMQECVGFNSLGYLKNKINNLSYINYIDYEGGGIYIKI